MCNVSIRLVLVSLVLLSACARSIEITPEERARREARRPLVGTWAWVRGESVGGFSGETPATAGYFEQLTFSEDGWLEIARNGAPRERIRFEVERVTYPDGRISEPRLFMTGAPTTTFEIRDGELTIRALAGGNARIYRRLS